MAADLGPARTVWAAPRADGAQGDAAEDGRGRCGVGFASARLGEGSVNLEELCPLDASAGCGLNLFGKLN